MHAQRMGRRLASLVVICAACGSTATAPLHPAGSAFDDGTGQLAALSGSLYYDGAGEGDPMAAERRSDQAFREDQSDYVGSIYAGSGYGGSIYGGAIYGGSYYGFGVSGSQINPPVPARPAPPPYYSVGVQTGGAVTGAVRWSRPPRAPATLTTACGEIANPTLALGAGGAVADTIVFLDNIARGRPLSAAARTLQIGGQLEHRGCTLVPAVQIVAPAPSSLELINAARAPVTLTVTGADPIALGPGVSRRTPLDATIVRISDSSGAVAPAWALGFVHPYVALTDADGKFRLDDIPAGSYELVVWHAPVATGMKDGQLVLSAPVIVRRPVTIAADRATAVAIDLPAAP